MDPSICWGAAAGATVACCYFSLSLGALRSYSLARFERLLEGDAARMQRVLKFLDDEERVVLGSSVLRGMMMTLGLIALTGGFIATTLSQFPVGEVGSWRWALVGAEIGLVGLGLFVVLGNTIPKAIGERRAEAILLRLIPSLRLVTRLAFPVTWLLGGISTVFLRVLNMAEVDEKLEAREDILSAALAGENEGVIDEATMDVIENLIDFRDQAVTEVMTPRIDICSVNATDDLDTLLRIATESNKSRLPVVEDSVDKIVGILIVKDLLKALKDPDLKPQSLFRKPIFVPETKRISDLLKELRQEKVHMAVVADEYGGTAGVVTIEDLIEEIIGEIDDEHDEVDVPLRRISPVLLDVDAKYHIDEMNEEFNTKIPEDEDVETLGGFIALRLGRIPETGDRVDLNGTSFVVTEADERRVTRVQVKFKKPLPVGDH